MAYNETNVDLALLLHDLTGDLAESPDRPGELERARRLLAQAGLRGQQHFLDPTTMPLRAPTPADVVKPSPDLIAIAAEESLTFKAAPEAAAGAVMLRAMRSALPGAQQTLGPFVGLNGRRVWLDLLADPPANPVFADIGVATEPYLVFVDGVSQRDSLTFDLPAGSIWIGGGLHPAAPFGQFIGIRIAGGTATFSIPPVLVGKRLRVSPSASLILELNPELPAGPAAFTPPSKARMAFNAADLTGFTAEVGTISALGAVVEFSPAGLPILESGQLHFGGDMTVLNTEASLGAVSIQLDGDWTVERALWSFDIMPINRQAPGNAFNSGRGRLDGGPGLNLSWTGLRTPVPMASVLAVALGNSIFMLAVRASDGARQTLRDPDGATLAELRFDGVTQIIVTSDGQPLPEHTFTVHCSGSLTPTSPLYADGAPIHLAAGTGTLNVIELSDGARMSVFLGGDPGNDRNALALSNAVLTVAAPSIGALEGDLLPSGALAASTARFDLRLLGVLPTLADPYAANFEPIPRVGTPTIVEVTAKQLAEGPATVTVSLPSVVNPAELLLSWMPQPGVDSLDFNGERMTAPQVAESTLRSGVTHWMLDVSTNSDQFGVAIGNPSQSVSASIRDGELQWRGIDLLVFAVPAIQWEPVADSTGMLLSTDDGGPSAFAVDTVRLVPVAPVEAAAELIDEYATGVTGHASMTLPFGIRARVRSTDANEVRSPLRPAIALDRASFPGFDTARQIRMSAASPMGILGFARQTNNIAGAAFGPGTNVLHFPGVPGSVIDQIFNTAFNDNFATATVPVERYDWSGYGASMFSQWVNPQPMPPNVSQVHFDVLTGRTSHEVVQVSAILWPCQAFLVRTITLERENSAVVTRHDSGWIASSPGFFLLPGIPAANQCPFHPGVVRGYFDIREIRDTPRVINVGGAQFQAVYFDADVGVAGVVKGHRNHRVPVQRHTGYVQFLPIGPTLLTPAQLAALLKQEGPIGGPLDCEMDIAASGNRMLVNSTFTELAFDSAGAPHFVVAVKGQPVFPRSGSWNAVRTDRAGQTAAVDAHAGLPLIREGLVSGGAQNPTHRFADPADLFQRKTPQTKYGFLFSTGSSRTLLPSPEIVSGQTKITGPFPARMADPSAVAISNGLFPKADSSLQFPGDYALDLGGANILDLKSATRAKELELVATKIMRLYVESSSGFNTLVNAADWTVDSSLPQTIFLDLLGFKKIISFQGKLLTDNSGKRTLEDARMDLSEDIDALKQVLEILKNLHLPEGVDFSLRTTGSGTLALDISVEGHLGKDDGSGIDTGAGKLSGTLRMGVVIRASITDGVQGEAFLEISGDYQQAIIPKVLYAGGFLRFRLGVDQDGKAALELNIGVAGSIGGDLIPGLIEVEGTVKYGYVLVLPDLGAGRIGLGATVGMEVRANLLSGLVAIKFGFEAGATLVPEDALVTVTVQIDVSASVTAAWVFRSRVHFHAEYVTTIPKVAVAAALVLTGVGVGPAAAILVS